jgi:hypothetical protein
MVEDDISRCGGWSNGGRKSWPFYTRDLGLLQIPQRFERSIVAGDIFNPTPGMNTNPCAGD